MKRAPHSFLEKTFNAAVVRLVAAASRLTSLPRPMKRALALFGDALCCALAAWIAISLRLDEWRPLDLPLAIFIGSVLIFWYPIAWFHGVYNAIFRYSGRGAMVSIAAAMVFTTLPLVAVYAVDTRLGIPRSMALLGPILFFMLMVLGRIVGRYVLVDLVHSRPLSNGEMRNVVVYGAGSVGLRLAHALAAEPGVRVVGIVDDDGRKEGQRLDGVKVYHSSTLGRIIDRKGATDVLLAMDRVSFARRREIVRQLSKLDVNVRTLPPVREVLNGHIDVDALRPIEIDDLLGRPPVAPDTSLLRLAVTGKSVMITGAGGSIGSEIVNQVASLGPKELVLVDFSEYALFETEQRVSSLLGGLPEDQRAVLSVCLADVSSEAAVERLFAEHKPDTIFHAAAYKHVPMIESNTIAGIRNNILGTWLIASAAERNGVDRFILISTDKAVRPPNVMGATKRVCEMILQARAAKMPHTTFTMVRFGNVLGSSGSVVPMFQRQIAEGGPVTVTHKQVTRYFMTIPEAAQLVIQAGALAEGGEVFVLDMGEPVKIWDLAKSMIRLAGLSWRENAHGPGDIEIREIGLRQGEKLYEELLIEADSQPTSHPRIMQARETFLTLEELSTRLSALESAIEDNDAEHCRRLLAEMVPSLSSPSDESGGNLAERSRNIRSVTTESDPINHQFNLQSLS